MSEQRRRLLIVEDDPALQKQMRWAFDGFEAVVASDRESAVAQLRRYEPAVVTMDLGLPPTRTARAKDFGSWGNSWPSRQIRRSWSSPASMIARMPCGRWGWELTIFLPSPSSLNCWS